MSDERGPVNYASWQKVSFWSCVVFALQSASWAVIGSFDPWGIWDRHVESALYDTTTDMDLAPYRHFLVGTIAGTSCGFFVLLAFLVAEPLRRRERWAWRAALAGVSCWFVIDSTASVLTGVWINAAFVNLPAYAILMIPLLAMRRGLA